MDQLYNTSVPLPFELVRAVSCQDEEVVEKKIDAVFSENRININPKREFFEISIEQVKSLFDLIVSEGNEDVSGEAINTGIDVDSQRAADSFKRKRRPNLTSLRWAYQLALSLCFTMMSL